MISLKRLLVLFSSCLAIAAAQTPRPVPDGKTDASAPLTVTVGGRDLLIPMPAEGFVRCDGINDVWDKAMSGFLPATNRLLGYFCTAADAEALRQKTQPDMGTNFNLQTLRKLETEEVGTKTFASISGSMRKELEGMEEQLKEKLKKAVETGGARAGEETNVEVALSLSDVAFVGFFDEANPSVLGFTMAMKGQGTIAGKEHKTNSITAAYMVPANGRLLLLYATRPFDGEADRKEAERSVKAWGEAIMASNIKVEGKAISSGAGGLFKNVGRSGLIGAIVGGLAALVGIVIAKSRRGAA